MADEPRNGLARTADFGSTRIEDLNLPLLLLGLYAGLLALSLAVAGWVGHAQTASDPARRVTDAGERAALLHLVAPAKLALLAVALLGALGASASAFVEGPTLAILIAPVLGAVAVHGAVYFSSQKLLRASAQVVGGRGADHRLTVRSRSLLAAVLCCEATVSLIL